MMQGGVCYQQRSWERRIDETGSGSPQWQTPTKPTGGVTTARWPTPRACSAMAASLTENNLRADRNLETAVARRHWPTRGNGTGGAEQLSNTLVVGGQTTPPTKIPPLNPSWVEWLMGWPIGWTSLEPMDSHLFRAWLRAFNAE